MSTIPAGSKVLVTGEQRFVQPNAPILHLILTSLISGANGFYGSWVSKLLLDRGYSVRGTTRTAAKGEDLAKALKHPNFEYAVVDDIVKVRRPLELTASPNFAQFRALFSQERSTTRSKTWMASSTPLPPSQCPRAIQKVKQSSSPEFLFL